MLVESGGVVHRENLQVILRGEGTLRGRYNRKKKRKEHAGGKTWDLGLGGEWGGGTEPLGEEGCPERDKGWKTRTSHDLNEKGELSPRGARGRGKQCEEMVVT